jgi:hypothetical protein
MQEISIQYGALDTSALHNDRFTSIIAPGIYAGYQVRPSTAPGYVDIMPGSDDVSVLVTEEGIIVRETSGVYSAVQIAAADPNLLRYDLIVAEFRRSSVGTSEQDYKVIRGRNQADLDTEPVKPSAGAYQIPLAYVRVRPRSQFPGSSAVQITLADIYQMPAVSWTAVSRHADLKPVISSADSRRLYVYPGVMTNSEGTRFIEFAGGFSSVIDDNTVAENSYQYYLFGVSDSGEVAVISQSDDKATLPDLTNDLLPVAIVKAQKIGGSIRLLEVTDVRIGIARNISPIDKSLSYHALFANSIFKYMRIEAFDDDSGIDLSTIELQTSGESDLLTAEISGVDSSLTITWTGTSNLPTEPVVITTEDLMAGGNLGTIKHFMMVADSAISGLQFYYSGSSKTGGFSTTAISPGSIVRTPGQGVRKLFLQMVIQPSAFTTNKQIKINSFGVFFQISDASLSVLSLNEIGLLSFSKTIPNLIANGDFYHWSKNQTDGSRLQLNSQEPATFTLNESSRVLADGWYASHLGFGMSGETVQRVVRDTSDFAVTTAIELVADAVLDTTNSVTVLEYRVAAAQELVGKEVTFAIGYESSQPATVSIGVAQFRRGDNGLEVFATTSATGSLPVGEIIVNSVPVSSSCEQISFYVMLTHSVGAVYRLYNARAAAGMFNSLEYNQAPDARSILRQYYERGRVLSATRSTTGGLVGASAQFGTPKATELGSVTIRLADESTSNRSVGVGEITFDADADGFVVTTTSTANGDATVDLDWEAFVAYEGSVI